MKEKLCEQLAEKITAGEIFSPEEKRHAEQCIDCRDFLNFQQKLNRMDIAGNFDVPETLDIAVKQASFRYLAHRRRTRFLCRVLIPAAAVIVLSAAVIFHNRTLPETKQSTPLAAAQSRSVKAWSGDYDEKLFNMTCDMDDAMSNMDESVALI